MVGVVWPWRYSSAPHPAALLLVTAGLALTSCSSQSVGGGDDALDGGMSLGTQGQVGSAVVDAQPYPLAQAPAIWAEQQMLSASDASASDHFGESVSVDGDTALIGAIFVDSSTFSSGAAYTFVRSAGSWTQQQKLTPKGDPAYHNFGRAVSLEGNTALIGGDGGNEVETSPGAAYVYTRAAGLWAEEAKLLAGDRAAYDGFGTSVSLSGGTALVGASLSDDGGSSSGSAYVFVRNATEWTEQQKLTASDAAGTDFFGGSVSLNGNTALIGATGNADAGVRSGSAYVFVRNAAVWSEAQRLRASDAAAGAYFGGSTSLLGDTAVIGARSDAEKSSGAGAAYVFVRSASMWSQQHKLTASDAAPERHFGAAISLSGDLALIGASGDFWAYSSGSAYLFARGADVWIEQAKLLASDSDSVRNYGATVSLSGDTALIGAYGHSEAGNNSGAAYVSNLRLGPGQLCSADFDCVGNHCAHGRCCDRACEGSCETCDQAGFEGTCRPMPKGTQPTSSCNGHLCSGDEGHCPDACAGELACTTENYCHRGLLCLPKEADGEACGRDAGCLSGHCVEGMCCDQACDDGCGSCVFAGQPGRCLPLGENHTGGPSCSPYLCSGESTSCATSCTSYRQCAVGFGCIDGACASDVPSGMPCVASEDCAAGDQCASSGRCETVTAVSGPTDEGGSCRLTSGALRSRNPLRGGWGLVLLSALAFGRGRRRRFAASSSAVDRCAS